MSDESAYKHFSTGLGLYVLDEKDIPVLQNDVVAWGLWISTHQRHLALTKFPWGCVSTIFLGVDSSLAFFDMPDPLLYKPVLWETMVFGGPLDQAQWRYTSAKEALEGHQNVVRQFQNLQNSLKGRIQITN